MSKLQGLLVLSIIRCAAVIAPPLGVSGSAQRRGCCRRPLSASATPSRRHSGGNSQQVRSCSLTSRQGRARRIPSRKRGAWLGHEAFPRVRLCQIGTLRVLTSTVSRTGGGARRGAVGAAGVTSPGKLVRPRGWQVARTTPAAASSCSRSTWRRRRCGEPDSARVARGVRVRFAAANRLPRARAGPGLC